MVDRYQPCRQDDMRESEDGEYVNWQDWLIEHGSRVTAQHRASELESKLDACKKALEFSIGREMQLGQLLYDKTGIDPVKLEPSGLRGKPPMNESPDREALIRFAEIQADTFGGWHVQVAELLKAALKASRTRDDYNLRCEECGAPHWIDTSLPSGIWNRIAPDADVLCMLCIDDRLAAAGMKVEARFYFAGEGLQSELYADDLRAQVSDLLSHLDAKATALCTANDRYDTVVEERDAALRRLGRLPDLLHELNAYFEASLLNKNTDLYELFKACQKSERTGHDEV